MMGFQQLEGTYSRGLVGRFVVVSCFCMCLDFGSSCLSSPAYPWVVGGVGRKTLERALHQDWELRGEEKAWRGAGLGLSWIGRQR